LEFAGCFQWIARTEVLEDESVAVVAMPWKTKAQKKRKTVVAVAAAQD
jgi:hypothetical protein